MLVLFRRIKKQPVIYSLKIAGLALGIATSALIFIYVNYESNYDRFHVQSDDVYRLVLKGENSNEGYARTAPAYVPAFKDEFPGVEAGFRLKPSSGYTEYDNKKIKEDNIYFVGHEIFEVLTIPLLEGNPQTALQAPNTVVLSQPVKEKYFGDSPALGKTIMLDGEIPLKVTGVFSSYPKQSHLDPQFLVSMNTYKAIRGADLDRIWQENIYYSYFKLKDLQAYQNITSQLDDFIQSHFQSDDTDSKNFSLALQPIASIHLNSHLSYEISPNGNKNNIYFLITVAVLILLVSVVNFINITTVIVHERFEEANVRKVLGASPRTLILQHLGETIALAYLATAIAALLIAVIQPMFTQLTSISLTIGYFFSSSLSYLFLIFPAGIALLAGLYPAFKFAGITSALRSGKSNISGGDSLFRNGLVVFQFCISLVLITATVIIYKQMNYVQNYNYGFTKEGIVVLPYDGQKFDLFKNELLTLPGVTDVTASGDIPGDMNTTLTYDAEGSGPEKSGALTTLVSDYRFLKTYDIKLISGRDFRAGNADLYNAIILNKKATEQLGWSPEEAVGKSFKLHPYGNEGRIIGVTENFHVYSLHKELEPVAIAAWPQWFGYVSVRVKPQHLHQSLTKMKAIWDQTDIAGPFDFTFLDQQFAKQYYSDRTFRKLFSAFSALALFIACLGLFGLIFHKTQSMEKELSIRKVLGATPQNLSLLIVKHTYLLFGIALIISTPLSYWAVQEWIKNFAYRTPIGMTPFLASGMILLIIITATILYHTLKAALQNPIIGLQKDQ